MASEEKEKKETKTHHYRTQHHHKEYNIKMVFATKLQINAVFKKAAPAKKTVTPAKKVRVVIHIVREESVSFEIRAHHHRLVLGGKRGRKRAKKKEKTQPTFSLTRDE